MPDYKYPLTKFFFEVAWGENVFGGFQEVTGLEVTRDKTEYRHGKDRKFVKRQIPAMKSYGDLTLKRGVFRGDHDFFKWWNGETNPEEDGTPERREITITMYNAKETPVLVWDIEAAWPYKFTATDLNAESNDVAVETLVLCHEGIKQRTDTK